MAIAFSDAPTSGPFHRTTLWHRTAPRQLFKAWFSGDDDRRWTVWKKHLARRRKPQPLEFLTGKRPAILWGWPEDWRRDEITHATSALARANAVHAASRTPTVSPPLALEVVSAAYALPALAAELPAGAWWQLAETLYRLAHDAQQLRVEGLDDGELVVRQQLLAGELPLALSYLFPELQPMRSLRHAARQSLSEALIAVTDGEGLLHARLLPLAGPIWACWTRARTIGERLHRGAWSRDAEIQYRWSVLRMIRLLDADGRVMLSGTDTKTETPDLKAILTCALDLAGDQGDAAAAATAVSKSVVPGFLYHSRKHLPDPSLESVWSCVSVLAGDWSRLSPRLAVGYANHPLRIELHSGGRILFDGLWTEETRCNGQRSEPVAPWEQLCWLSNKKCDFFELGLQLSGGVKLERQMLLAKRDRLLLLADIISTTDGSPHDLRHSFSLPLARHVSWLPEAETRDGVLVTQKQRTAVLPVGLHEWRCDPRGGTLVCENGRLTLSQSSTGRALYCGLVLDLDPKRSKKPRTWRGLTIAESMQVVPADLAVGFRAQSGSDQWLFYRSLGPAGNRSVLGQNLSSEFCAGPFRESGLIDEWIEIEAESS